MKEGQELITESGHKIIYDIVSGDDNYIVFLSGLMSDRLGSKATYLKEFCKKQGYSYICFDYLGHGDSDLDFTECNLDIWLANISEILDELIPKKAILVGSSLGGWLAIRLAEKKHPKIAAILGLAAAPDFTEDLIWSQLDKKNKELLKKGQIYNLPSEYCEANYAITYQLIESGRRNLLLNKEKIKIEIPVRLLQAMEDDDVPYGYAIKLAEKITSKNLSLQLIKNSDHRLSDEYARQKIIENLEDILKFYN